MCVPAPALVGWVSWTRGGAEGVSCRAAGGIGAGALGSAHKNTPSYHYHIYISCVYECKPCPLSVRLFDQDHMFIEGQIR